MADYLPQDDNMDMLPSPYMSGKLANMDECSSGFQSACPSNFQSSLPSSSSTCINEYPPQPPVHLPPPPPPLPKNESPSMLAEPSPPEIIWWLEKEVIGDTRDPVVLANSSIYLYSLLTRPDSLEYCRLTAASDEILSTMYYILDNEIFMHNYHDGFCASTANLTIISNYEDGRVALLRQSNARLDCSTSGLGALIRSLRSREVRVDISAITAIHNLLLDLRPEVQEEAKNQVKKYRGIHDIVQLLDIAFDGAMDGLIDWHDYQYKFKVIVLNCIQILAYGKENSENRLAIKESGGPKLIIKNIRDYFNQPSDDLLDIASRALKSLSVCKENKKDMILQGGIEVLTDCLHRNNPDILKTCLWTIRNLSDLINETVRGHGILTPSVIKEDLINVLINRLLIILDEYPDDHCIVTCALGTLANLTCDIKSIKELVCKYDGIERILRAVDSASSNINSCNFHIAERDMWECDLEILDPTVHALCHLFNQTHYTYLQQGRPWLQKYFYLFRPLLYNTSISSKLAENVRKLEDYANARTQKV